ncbi:Holliday junction resolvase [Thermosipho affectus]|uniref:Holliday junction resolvase n=1 Tax=Thermosipho affectus TaxID=660294 RepID=A0ABX3IJY4_9BACT|nr:MULTISPECIES: RuvX/YqgF family protein [Thermosipho]ANQ53410.1 Holliday junction resolvase [Thermosipho sp. 1070]APT71859.1 Holliday junction resolvase [Thermosipho sp. 1063]ONN27638.1 Holliday junction resolvase [Thermosipho affectus]OOC44996.1 Holliday junction resolvase [Thermosipho sp. 1074]
MILALDYGDKKTGYAIGSDFISKSGTVNTTQLNKLLEKFQKVVLGIPLSMSGNYSKQSFKVLKFAYKLKRKGIDVFLIDERLTTKMALSFNAKDDDAFSARQIFMDYIKNPILSQKFVLEKFLDVEFDCEDVEDVLYYEVTPVKGRKGDALTRNFSIAFLHMKEKNFVYRNEDTIEKKYNLVIVNEKFKDVVDKFLKNGGKIILV